MVEPNSDNAVPESRTLGDFSSANHLLQELLRSSLFRREDWDILPAPVQEELSRQSDCTLLLRQLVEKGLLTGYQVERISQGGPAELLLTARLVTISDVYDALRSRRVYKPALSHADALRVMLEESAGHFDPALLQVFQPSPP
jgi:hypothetical protein